MSWLESSIQGRSSSAQRPVPGKQAATLHQSARQCAYFALFCNDILPINDYKCLPISQVHVVSFCRFAILSSEVKLDTDPFAKLKKTDPKAQQLGICQGTLRSNRTATRHRPVTQTANAADGPSFVQNVWPAHEVCSSLRNKWNR